MRDRHPSGEIPGAPQKDTSETKRRVLYENTRRGFRFRSEDRWTEKEWCEQSGTEYKKLCKNRELVKYFRTRDLFASTPY